MCCAGVWECLTYIICVTAQAHCSVLPSIQLPPISTYYSVARDLLKEMKTLLSDKYDVFEGLNKLIIGPRSLYDAGVTVVTDIVDGRRRSRELKRNGFSYSDDYELEAEQVLGDEGPITAFSGTCNTASTTVSNAAMRSFVIAAASPCIQCITQYFVALKLNALPKV
jgi:hypothetical protein